MIYVLSHTHWDREWFVTQDHTRKWIPKLVEELLKILEKHPDFEYVLDGQTLILEDLWSVDGEMAEKVQKYVESGNLKIGPVYAQIDWRISIPQAVWKNFELGRSDCERYGGCFEAGWFMDNFGQISQLPQLMNLFGMKYAFVWRGVGDFHPAFVWRSPDGSEVKVVSLVGGYRTLYNLMDTSDIARERFEHEVEKLSRLGNPVVLMDGYDLDVHPEDPRDYLSGDFSTRFEDLFEELERIDSPVVEGELISGKIASVFPGTLSTRSYLKLGADLVGKLLTTLEFISVYSKGERPEDLWREYLKTLVHDNICGVGVDQVHDGMEEVYRRLYSTCVGDIWRYAEKLSLDGRYVFSPAEYHGKFTHGDEVHSVDSDGVGLWRIESWRFEKTSEEGFQPFRVLLERELGDAYSSSCKPLEFEERVEHLGSYTAQGVKRFVFERRVKSDGISIETLERYDLIGDITWLSAEMRFKGCCYRFSFVFDVEGDVFAGMPFDVVKRECVDEDLLPEDEDLGGLLLAARETGSVNEFPMQDFVAVVSGKTFAVVSKGLRSYVCVPGRIVVPVVRSVEWITKRVPGRTGDAGPKMYVPGARSERKIRLEMGIYRGDLDPRSEEFLSMVRFFSWPRLILEARGGENRDVPMFENGSILPGVVCHDGRIKTVEIEGKRDRDFGSRVVLRVERFPFEEDESEVDESVLRSMEEEVARLRKDLEKIDRGSIEEDHRYWTDLRRCLEMELSIHLNEMKRLEKVVNETARDLNEIRRKKRTYDYLLEMRRWS